MELKELKGDITPLRYVKKLNANTAIMREQRLLVSYAELSRYQRSKMYYHAYRAIGLYLHLNPFYSTYLHLISMIQRTRINHWLRRLVGAEHYQQIAHHGRLLLLVEVYDSL